MVALVEARQVVKTYHPAHRTAVQALRGVDLMLEAGKVMGLVGESGSGKSTLGRCLLGLDAPSAGHVFFEGDDMSRMPRRRRRVLRREMQLIFQDPAQSLDPRQQIEAILAEPLLVQRLCRERRARRSRLAALLKQVGLAEEMLHRYPHELSGGQRQRVAIARALVGEPRCIVADEPVSALDLSVQAQILNLLGELQRQRGLTFLFIAHDLRIVRRFCHRVAVMYQGCIVEEGPAQTIAEQALHPYTIALAAAVPRPDPRGIMRPRQVLQGEVPSPSHLVPGCPFHPRCPRYAMQPHPLCRQQQPRLREVGSQHCVACHLAGTGLAGSAWSVVAHGAL